MNTLHCMVVDDDPIAGKIIASYIARDKRLSLAVVHEHPEDALVGLSQMPVDILFLDIEMPDMSGMELLSSLVRKPHVIFTTARREFALDAFDLHATDYLLKPISFERFLRAVNKVFETISPIVLPEETPRKDENIWLKSDGKLIKIDVQNILYIESDADYVHVVTTTGKFIALQSLKNVEDALDAERFCRVHRSYIVAVGHIDSIEGNMLRMGSHTIPVGRSFRDALFACIARDKHL